jgi:type IV fimbrial biogenesis protein FimT
MAIFSALAVSALPSYQRWLLNAQVRTLAEALQGGFQTARNEAVKRNGRVELVFTDSDITPANVALIVPNAAGRAWVVRAVTQPPAPVAYSFVQARSLTDGTSTAQLASVPLTSSVGFSALGRSTVAVPVVFSVTDPAAGSCMTGSADGVRCLDVVVNPSGQIRTCDPRLNSAINPQGC